MRSVEARSPNRAVPELAVGQSNDQEPPSRTALFFNVVLHLWQIGLWIKQECEKFDYTKPALEYLRYIWVKHRDYLTGLQEPGSDATNSAST